jgi:hypothetical protein
MTQDQLQEILQRAAEDRSFAERLRAEPMVALAGYQLTPSQRDQIFLSIRRAGDLRIAGLVSNRVARSVESGESARFSTMSLAELYELAWAAGEGALIPAPPELLAHTNGSFRAWYQEQEARSAHNRKTASYWRPHKLWAEALLAELEKRKEPSAPDHAADLEEACARVRTFVEQF